MKKLISIVALLLCVLMVFLVVKMLYGSSEIHLPESVQATTIGGIEVWTIDEFEAWMNEKLAEYQSFADQGSNTYYEKNAEGVYVTRAWKQSDVEEFRKIWEEQLQKMKEGHVYTKPIEGTNMIGVFQPGELSSGK